jgi:hypothetical protein
MWVDDLRRSYECLVDMRKRPGVSFEEWDALITASAVVRVRLEESRDQLARQCEPWFRVQ